MSKKVFTGNPLTIDQIETAQNELKKLQDDICTRMIKVAPTWSEKYKEDNWSYDKGEGGGRTRVWDPYYATSSNSTNNNKPGFWEKAGCNYSGIKGESLPVSAIANWEIPKPKYFYATGVSLVAHATNPWVPSLHANVRLFATDTVWWVGGGIDLTPNYPRINDVIEFHTLIQKVCQKHSIDYEKYKKVCDDYFFLSHRGETRGVGGIFIDSMQICEEGGEVGIDDSNRSSSKSSFEKTLAFILDLGRVVIDIFNLITHHVSKPFTRSMRDFQRYRRGRYVEFNLLFDRGTKFGIVSKGRTESILMSLPSRVHWRYDAQFSGERPKVKEDYLYHFYLKPQPWLSLSKDEIKDLQQLESKLYKKNNIDNKNNHVTITHLIPITCPFHRKEYYTAIGGAAIGLIIGYFLKRK